MIFFIIKIKLILTNASMNVDMTDRKSIYIIAEVNTNRYKVGFSQDPETRILQLQTGNSNQLELFWQSAPIPHYRATELNIHEYLRSNNMHAHGEWFDMDSQFVKCNLIPYIENKVFQEAVILSINNSGEMKDALLDILIKHKESIDSHNQGLANHGETLSLMNQVFANHKAKIMKQDEEIWKLRKELQELKESLKK